MTLLIDHTTHPAPICHHGHASSKGVPCTESATLTVNGVPYCSRHAHELVSTFASGLGERGRASREVRVVGTV